MQEMRIYPLKEIPEEITAVAFAKTSRSPEAFDKIAAELNADSSSKFHDKWVVGYGHSSVAEHAVAHLAAENISRLAVECIESNRLIYGKVHPLPAVGQGAHPSSRGN